MAAPRNALGWYVVVIRSDWCQGEFLLPCKPAPGPARCVSVWRYSIYLTRTYREGGYSSVQTLARRRPQRPVNLTPTHLRSPHGAHALHSNGRSSICLSAASGRPAATWLG